MSVVSNRPQARVSVIGSKMMKREKAKYRVPCAKGYSYKAI